MRGEFTCLAARCDDLWSAVDIFLVSGAELDGWPPEEDSYPSWGNSLRANLLAPIFLTKHLGPALGRSGHGSVIYYGSIDGIRANPRVPAYSASRGALIPYTHIMAHLYGPKGARVKPDHAPQLCMVHIAFASSRRAKDSSRTRLKCHPSSCAFTCRRVPGACVGIALPIASQGFVPGVAGATSLTALGGQGVASDFPGRRPAPVQPGPGMQ
jgi:NADP-dependent 3-hydroxy acid dehydrogenase YdfG